MPARSGRSSSRSKRARPCEHFLGDVGQARVLRVLGRQLQPVVGDRPRDGELGTHNAIFLTRGLGNSFQAVSELVVYTYLTNAHWEAGLQYRAVSWDDPELGVAWPITDDRLKLSAKDTQNPSLADLGH